MLRPPPQLNVSEWAEHHRILGSRASSEPGPWRTSRTPYLRDVMDALSAVHPARRIVLMKGALVSSAEWCLRVARRISRASFSAGARVGGAEDLCLIFTLLGFTRSQKSSVTQFASLVPQALTPDSADLALVRVVRRAAQAVARE